MAWVLVGGLLAGPLLALPALAQALVPIPQTRPIGVDEQLFGTSGDRSALVRAIDYSLRYLNSAQAVSDYQKQTVPGMTRDRVRRSLQRFRQLVITAPSAEALQAAVNQEFVWYRSVGNDNQGTVAFTGYFEPVYPASRVPTPEFRYPLFRRPSALAPGQLTRLQLEGADGLQYQQSVLRGRDFVYLRDRLQAFLIQVQGSARLALTDGSVMTVGYDGNNGLPYGSIGRELVNAGKFTLEELTLPKLIQYFQQHPQELDTYLPRNRSFIFFRNTAGAAATGSLKLPVTPDRSIATDKTKFPPGALALIQATIPYPTPKGDLVPRPVWRYVLDQDTGSAIKGAGRVDIFLGTGKLAGDRAGLINSTGSLYYLLLPN